MTFQIPVSCKHRSRVQLPIPFHLLRKTKNVFGAKNTNFLSFSFYLFILFYFIFFLFFFFFALLKLFSVKIKLRSFKSSKHTRKGLGHTAVSAT